MALSSITLRLHEWLDRPGGKMLCRPASKLPSYAELCRRWESQAWGVPALDFRLDREQWRLLPLAEQQIWRRRLVGIFRGEVVVAETLGVYLSALARQDQGRYVTTQIADEVQHARLFERFHREVQGLPEEQLEGELAATGSWTDRAYRTLLTENLPALCGRLRADPRDRGALIEGVTLLHLLIEGGLGMARLKKTARELEIRQLFPALRQGLLLIGRDEVRHFLFGLRFLHEALIQEPAHIPTVVKLLASRLPLVAQILGGPQEGEAALRRLERGLRFAGLEVPLVPASPFPPGQTSRSESYAAREADGSGRAA